MALKPAALIDIDQIETIGRYREQAVSTIDGRRMRQTRILGELTRQADQIAEIAACMIDALSSGHSILIAGNGGSAAEAQHFAAELVGRFQRERAPYPALALTADSSILTAISNDYGFEQVFARQVRGLGHPGDVLIAISTSGESRNLVEAVNAAREMEMTVVAMTGRAKCSLVESADHGLCVDDVETAMAQEIHMLITHILCGIVESELADRTEGMP